MNTRQSIQDLTFLSLASAESAYSWLQGKSNPWAVAREQGAEGIPEEIEGALLAKNSKVVDLGLAAWSQSDSTLSKVYDRYLTHSPSEALPQPGSYEHGLLAALLGNESSSRYFFKNLHKNERTNGVPKERIFQVIAGDAWELAKVLHMNPIFLPELITLLSKKQEPYDRIPERHWLLLLATLGDNPRILAPAEDSPEGPDMPHSDICQRRLKTDPLWRKNADVKMTPCAARVIRS